MERNHSKKKGGTKMLFVGVFTMLSGLFMFNTMPVLNSILSTVGIARAAVILVDDVGDAGDNNPGDGNCDTGGGVCTLRAAIEEANALAGIDTINFDIPGVGPHEIVLGGSLPDLDDDNGVLIDGCTQLGSSPNTLGAGQGFDTVLKITIDGNIIEEPILTVASTNNVITCLNFQNGLDSQLVVAADNNTVQGNFFGTNITGTVAAGSDKSALHILGEDIIVGVDGDGLNDVAEGNLISGTNEAGIFVVFSTNYRISGNLIGTNAAGTAAIPNTLSGVVVVDSAPGLIGTDGDGVSDALERNVLSGNGDHGIGIAFADGATVAGNYIGTDVTGLVNLGNASSGVALEDQSNTIVGKNGDASIGEVNEANVIAYNGDAGILVYENVVESDQNMFSENVIFNNGGLGIDLSLIPLNVDGVTVNDAGDVDIGPNNLLNRPLIVNADSNGANGTIDIDTDPTQARVELYVANNDPSGSGEGQNFIGVAVPDAFGNWNIVTPLGLGDDITALVIDVNNNTSEFSANVVVQQPADDVPLDLLTENKENPQFLTIQKPKFSAVFQNADNGAIADQVQVQVATDQAFANVIFDTGLVGIPNCAVDERCAEIQYAGPFLSTGKKHFVRMAFAPQGEGVGQFTQDDFFILQGGGRSVNDPLLGPVGVPPAAPTFDNPQAVSTTSIEWRYIDNANNEQDYRLIDNKDTFLQLNGRDVEKFVETDLQPNRAYTRKVVAMNGAGFGESPLQTVFTLADVPLGLEIISAEPTAVTVGVTGLDTDDVRREQKYLFKMVNGAVVESDLVQGTQYTFAGLEPNHTYQFSVRTENGDGVATEFSPILEFTTGATIVVEKPTENTNGEQNQTSDNTTNENGNNIDQDNDIFEEEQDKILGAPLSKFEGYLLRGPDKKVYLIEDGLKRHVINLDTLAKGFIGKKILDVDEGFLTKFPTNNELHEANANDTQYSNDNLLRAFNETMVYYIEQGEKREIMGLSVLQKRFGGKEIYDVLKEVLDSFVTGLPIFE